MNLTEPTTERFDRKTFDPVNNEVDKRSLEILRSRGHARASSYREDYGIMRGRHKEHHIVCCGSTALRQIHPMRVGDGQVLIDIGCGDSVDVLIAAKLGYKALGVDLFPPSVSLGESFIQADAVEGVPVEDGSASVVLCQAMIDLVLPDERITLYKEIHRTLAPNGVLSFTGIDLHCGYGYLNAQEVERARLAGFRAVSAESSGFVAVK